MAHKVGYECNVYKKVNLLASEFVHFRNISLHAFISP